jgi:hypothetical protein
LLNPINGTVTYFRYTVGGATTPFTFNGFDLRGSTAAANLSFTLQGYLGGNLVQSAVLNLTGNTFSTFTENWTNVDTIVIASTGALPVNWGSGTLYMDNVRINEPAPLSEAPEPTAFLIWSLLGVFGLVLGWRQRHRSACASIE